MNRLFHIPPNNGKPDVLLCEVSHHHLCLAAAGRDSKEIFGLSYFESQKPISGTQVAEALGQFKAFETVVVASAFPEAVVLPEYLFTKKRAADLLQLQEEPLPGTVFYNVLEEQNVVVVYAVPDYIRVQIPGEKVKENLHAYSCQLKQDNLIAQDQLSVHFESREFRVVAKKDQQLLLAQTYAYHSPLDVVYFLLAICRDFDLSQSTTAVVLSGLIAEDSSLFKELNQYFLQIHFAAPESVQLPQHHYPKHFFSSLHNLAACVL